MRLAGAIVPCRIDNLSAGRVRLDALPHLPGEEVTLEVAWEGPPGGLSGSQGTPTSDEPPAALVRATMPDNLATQWRIEPRLEGRCTGPLGHEDVDFDADIERPLRIPEEGHGTLRVRLLDRGGRPIVPTEDELKPLTLDPDGWLVGREVTAGVLPLRYTFVGRLPLRGRVRIPPAAWPRPRSGSRRGDAWRSRSWMRAAVPGPAPTWKLFDRTWFDCEGGLQRVDCLTDARGRRSIARVEPGPVQVHAAWFGQQGLVRVVVEDGATTRVRVVVD